MAEARPKEASDKLRERFTPEVIRKLRLASKQARAVDIEKHEPMNLPPSGTTPVSVRYASLDVLLDAYELLASVREQLAGNFLEK